MIYNYNIFIKHIDIATASDVIDAMSTGVHGMTWCQRSVDQWTDFSQAQASMGERNLGFINTCDEQLQDIGGDTLLLRNACKLHHKCIT